MSPERAKVIVGDDYEEDLKAAIKTLKEGDHNVIGSFMRASEGLNIAQETIEKIDVAVLDASLIDWGGQAAKELLALLKEREIPIIVNTSDVKGRNWADRRVVKSRRSNVLAQAVDEI